MSRIPPEFSVVITDELVAQYPPEVRGSSRLIVLDRSQGKVVHVGIFPDILRFLGDVLLILNETKVIPARVTGRKFEGGALELLFLPATIEAVSDSPMEMATVQALILPSNKLRKGLTVYLPGDTTFHLNERCEDGGWIGDWRGNDVPFGIWLDEHGEPPLPPYIHRKAEPSDRDRYQTIYAKHPGSVAAPTAGLHFTPELLASAERGGATVAMLRLDVGLGTFKPIRNDNLAEHKMHRESYFISAETAGFINKALATGRRIIAVGTTSVRALEAAAKKGVPLAEGDGSARLFIYPPYQFQIASGLLTNFHRPDSTLLQLVAAMTGWNLLNEAYQRAVDERFRFFSYGDAMLIL